MAALLVENPEDGVGALACTPGLVPVLAAVINRNSKYLVCRRPLDKRYGGMWEFPGGKLEPEETLTEAACRELWEELSLVVRTTLAPLIHVRDRNSEFTIIFTPAEADGDPVAHEHSEVRWVSLVDLLDLDLAPADEVFAEWLARH